MRSFTTSRLTAHALTTGVLALGLCWVGPDPATAQDAQSTDGEHTTVTGRVVDAGTGQPLASTVVRVAETRHAIMTDADGRFALLHVPVGIHTLTFEQLGYTPLSITQTVEPDGEPILAELPPMPVVLEGLKVMVDRFAARRQAAGVSVRLLRPDDFRAQPVDLFSAVRTRGGLGLVGCTPRGRVSTWCIISRGSYVEPRVWVDDRPAMGIEELELYRTHDVYAVEVYQAGRAIRVYTRDYIQRVAIQPRSVFPVWDW